MIETDKQEVANALDSLVMQSSNAILVMQSREESHKDSGFNDFIEISRDTRMWMKSLLR